MITIFAMINDQKHQEMMPLADLLEWYPYGISTREFNRLPKSTQLQLLKECSEAYWLDVLNIEFDIEFGFSENIHGIVDTEVEE